MEGVKYVYMVWLFNACPEDRFQGAFSTWSEAASVANTLSAQGYDPYIACIKEHTQHNRTR